jgi:hypothetical protein
MISRELRRNILRHDAGGYDGDLAHVGLDHVDW